MKTLFFNMVIAILLLGSNQLIAQEENFKQNLSGGNKVKIQSIIFRDIESGITNNDVKKFSQYFEPPSGTIVPLIPSQSGYNTCPDFPCPNR